MTSALDHIRILDLSRILAGPVCTQILGDLGADIIKVERPGQGDDTRFWGPPFLKDGAGRDTNESAYYLSCNRNKRSVTIDITQEEGQALIHALAAKSDVLIHNFKPGGIEKYGLGYNDLRAKHPRLIYAAISGFGQTGPMAAEPGYDLAAQAMGGLMAHTGAEDAEPTKAGVALIDVMTGLYAATGILAALQAREKTGIGQMLDLALLDVSLASMVNIAQYYLTSGAPPKRHGNAHATIVPYQSFATKDGHIVVAVGNDAQFRKFSGALKQNSWADDVAFATNAARVANRDSLVPLIADILKTKLSDEWLSSFRALQIPASPVNRIDQVFAMDQVQSRGMEIAMPHVSTETPVALVGNPLHLSDTPVSYRHGPPTLGQHTDEILSSLLNLSTSDIKTLRDKQVI